jgi:hypothetical protein
METVDLICSSVQKSLEKSRILCNFNKKGIVIHTKLLYDKLGDSYDKR